MPSMDYLTATHAAVLRQVPALVEAWVEEVMFVHGGGKVDLLLAQRGNSGWRDRGIGCRTAVVLVASDPAPLWAVNTDEGCDGLKKYRRDWICRLKDRAQLLNVFLGCFVGCPGAQRGFSSSSPVSDEISADKSRELEVDS